MQTKTCSELVIFIVRLLTDMDMVKLKAFISYLFSQMSVEMLVYGNVTKNVRPICRVVDYD